MSSADTDMKDAETALSEEVMQMSTDDLVARTRLIDNECKMMRSGFLENSYFKKTILKILLKQSVNCTFWVVV